MPVLIDTVDTGAPEDFGALSRSGHGVPRLRIVLTPYRSLTPDGFVWFIGLTATLICLPLLAVIGTSLFWGLLPFILGTVAAIWAALKRSWRDRALYEELVLWDDLIRLERVEPRRPPRDWEANPYWVRVNLHAKGGPVPNYVTLSGGSREVELGAFLTPGERVALKARLERELRAS
ncbi:MULTISPECIES: DUF2244 domain-containing protein [Paracoccaceae]|jgi:uncharacterized membrane protein|uniref:DUF2244 domain-containing protein n=1 Tax=Rhodobacterales TaxID=204455 RepID=UPI001B1105C1|nr:DUF2244 domain-containing protein [Boseongicola sp. H5]MBO6603992.1 DUF2244 domain-containing protein [Roseicyclus sp.]MBO6625587.1 DUF2244 domain-containing protein [Roseicyclus sp.]MBO6921751.1 DUF2244 domain-containing protein [Roseicyclus sp.]